MHQDRKETPAAFLREGVVGEEKSRWREASAALEAAPSGMRAEMLKELAFYGGSLLLPTTPQVFPPTTLQDTGTYNERNNTPGPERSRKGQAVVRSMLYALAVIAVMVMLTIVFAGAASAAPPPAPNDEPYGIEISTTTCGEPLQDLMLCQL